MHHQRQVNAIHLCRCAAPKAADERVRSTAHYARVRLADGSTERVRTSRAEGVAAGVLRREPMQAQCDNLTATSLAGRNYRQVYSAERPAQAQRYSEPGAVGGRLQSALSRAPFLHRRNWTALRLARRNVR